MKKFGILILISSFLSLTIQDDSSTPALEKFNGWEFLEWTWSKIQVEKELAKRKIKFDPGSPNQKQGPTTVFEYMGLNTRLAYDSNHLYDIQQTRYFSSKEGEQAIAALDELITHNDANYGKYQCEKDPDDPNTKKITWTTEKSIVILYYKHDPEVMKELDDESHIIYIHTNEYRD